jgi:peptidoglycan hydrolase CwlO-like protein
MGPNETSILTQYLGEFVACTIALVFLSKKLFTNWKANTAESSIITLMHNELERMSQQNTSLSLELGRLQQEVIKLNNQLQKLTVENQRLQQEVIVLTREVTRLQVILHKGEPNGSTN